MYNSDLNLPRTAGEAFASPFAAPVFPRSCQRDAAHAPLHAAACRSGAASRDEIPFFRLPIRFSGVRPADYYVYRLRRLLI